MVPGVSGPAPIRRAAEAWMASRMLQTSARTEKFLEAGRRVIRTEAEGLSRLADRLGAAFSAAVALIAETEGRIIVSGIGKSGHIARKIASTLASTGTPAHFVHPAEASHGDLGMLARTDAVLALSNSGETPELANLVAYAKRFRIPLVSVVGKDGTALARQSDVAIVLPVAEEACGRDVVPTTSTVMALAVGDALAVALMEHRAFSPNLFREFHPGGSLGNRLSRVRDLMHEGSAIPFVDESSPMPEALIVMSQKGFGVVGILSPDGRLSGIITDGDLRRHMAGLLENSASDVMTRAPLTIDPDALAEEALALMNEREVTCLFAVSAESSGAPEGILHIHDCLRAGIG